MKKIKIVIVASVVILLVLFISNMALGYPKSSFQQCRSDCKGWLEEREIYDIGKGVTYHKPAKSILDPEECWCEEVRIW